MNAAYLKQMRIENKDDLRRHMARVAEINAMELIIDEILATCLLDGISEGITKHVLEEYDKVLAETVNDKDLHHSYNIIINIPVLTTDDTKDLNYISVPIKTALRMLISSKSMIGDFRLGAIIPGRNIDMPMTPSFLLEVSCEKNMITK